MENSPPCDTDSGSASEAILIDLFNPKLNYRVHKEINIGRYFEATKSGPHTHSHNASLRNDCHILPHCLTFLSYLFSAVLSTKVLYTLAMSSMQNTYANRVTLIDLMEQFSWKLEIKKILVT
jgi:hypothetical protein